MRAYVASEPLMGLIKIAIVRETSDGRPGQILRILDVSEHGDPTLRFDDIDPAMQISPTLVLPDSDARALLDGLAAHYHGSSETQSLRADYEHERKRVDDLIGAVTVIAQSLAVSNEPR